MAAKIVYGTEYQDIISYGNSLSDDGNDYKIYTYGGNDKLTLYVGGTQYIETGDGEDEVQINGSGDATVYGGNGVDRIGHFNTFLDFNGTAKLYGGNGDDVLFSEVAGNDVLDGGADNDRLVLAKGNKGYGGTGNDTFDLSAIESESDVTLYENAGQGYDIVQGKFGSFHLGANFEEYQALSGRNASIWGNDLANIITMSSGNDTVRANGGSDLVVGGAGNDLIYGGAGDDTLFGANSNKFIDIIDGNDTIYGEDGDDKIWGGQGADTLSGGAGNDYLWGGYSSDGANILLGGSGNDFYVTDGGDTITEDANAGIDTVMFMGTTYTLGANIENLTNYTPNPFFQSYSPKNVTITGNALANVITIEDGAAVIDGGAGADTLTSDFRNDTIRGGDDDDRIDAGSGDDLLYGDAGNDRIYGGDGADSAYGGTGNDELSGNDGNDFLIGQAGNDTVYGGIGGDFINGGDGYDKLYGEAGNDTIRGGALNDYLYGNDGNDTLYGDGGSDFLWGGDGSDVFKYTALTDSQIGTIGIDRIQDFAKGFDKIDLSVIDANSALAGNQAFTWGGMSQPANHAGNLWGQAFAASTYNPAFVRVYGDVNGDGTADFQIDVMNHTALSATDFVL